MRREILGCLFGFVCCFTGGCLSQAEVEAGLKDETSSKIECPAEKITIKNMMEGEEGKTPTTFDALGCDREWKCKFFTHDTAFGPPKERVCIESEDSKERTSQKNAIHHLSSQSGCSVHRIVVNPGVWSNGNKRIYRMGACGQQYVCTQTAGKVVCKEGSNP